MILKPALWSAIDRAIS